MKRLIALAIIGMVAVIMAATWTPSPSGLSWEVEWRVPGTDTSGGTLYVDSTASTDTSFFTTIQFDCDSLLVEYGTIGWLAADDDSGYVYLIGYDMFLREIDTALVTKQDACTSATAADPSRVFLTKPSLWPKMAVCLKIIGTAKKPDSVKVIITPLGGD